MRPNVARMKRAMERDQRHHLLRHRELRIPLDIDSTFDDIERQAGPWLARIRRLFPDARLTTWTDSMRDHVIARWDPR